jgi:hypothetical protein
MACERGFLHSTCKVKDLEGRIVRSGYELGICRRERKVTDWVIVSLDDLNIVEIRLPVFDDAILISGQKPVIAMRI